MDLLATKTKNSRLIKNYIHLLPSKPANMLKVLIILAFSFLCFNVNGQGKIWHLAVDTLKPPSSATNTQVAISFFNRFDTVECRYKTLGSDIIQKGFKFVFILEGFYIDTPNTLNIFFDDRKQRINSVEKFYFN